MADKVFINGRSAVHAGSAGKSTCFPDVNLCPPPPPAGPVPIPLPNIARAADLQGGADTVFVGGNPIGKQSSYLAKSTGNEAARTTGGGIVTHVVQGKAYFVSHSIDVVIEGEPAVRHLDLMTHNHAGPSPPNGVVTTYLGTMDPAAVGKAKLARKQRKDDGKPQAIEFFFDHVGNRPAGGVESLLLVSHDGKYKKTLPVNAATPRDNLFFLRFENVLPGKTYTLYMMFGNEKIVFFENVPFAKIAEYSPGDGTPTPGKAKRTAPGRGSDRPEEFSEPPAHPDDWYEPSPWTRK